MPPTVRKLPPFSPPKDSDPPAAAAAGASAVVPDDATPPPGWQAPAPGSRGRAGYRRTDGAEVFFDRRSRPDDPLDAVRPGWNWIARRPEGTLLGHRVAAPVGGPVPEGGLFLPRKFKTAGEAMRALDRDAPARPPAGVTPDTGDHGAGADGIAGALARLEARGGDLLGPDGALLPRVGLTWEQVGFDGPLTLAALAASNGENPATVRGALADPRAAGTRGLTVVPIGEDDVCALRRLAEKLIAAPGGAAAQRMREFMDFLVAGAAPPAATKARKRIVLGAPPSERAAA